MSAIELSSIKWEENGEMSAQDALNLVCMLTETEEHDLASSQLEFDTPLPVPAQVSTTSIRFFRPVVKSN